MKEVIFMVIGGIIVHVIHHYKTKADDAAKTAHCKCGKE